MKLQMQWLTVLHRFAGYKHFIKILNPPGSLNHVVYLRSWPNSLALQPLLIAGVLMKSAACQERTFTAVQCYLVLKASLAAKHKNKPPVALSITWITRLFFNTADAKCVDKMSVSDHIVPIATWMLTRIKVHIKGE